MRRYKITKTWILETTFKLTEKEALNEIFGTKATETKFEEL